MNQAEVLVPAIKNALPQLSTVKSCAMIGCGTGHIELSLVGECCPNVTELAAVEPDADQMVELKTNVSQQIPTVSDPSLHNGRLTSDQTSHYPSLMI